MSDCNPRALRSCDGSGRLLPRMSGRQRPPELGACQVSSGGTTEAGVSSVSTGEHEGMLTRSMSTSLRGPTST